MTGAPRDRGQAAVEFALAIPLVIVLALGVIQVAVVIAGQLQVELAAREAARAAAVAGDPAGAAARAASGIGDVSASESSGAVTVTVQRRFATSVPIVGRLIGDVDQRASVTMAIEPP